MIFLAILFALSILVIEYTIAQKFLEKDASILVYAGGIVVVLFIAIIDGLLFTMGLTEKVDVTATYLGLCLPSGLLLLAFARHAADEYLGRFHGGDFLRILCDRGRNLHAFGRCLEVQWRNIITGRCRRSFDCGFADQFAVSEKTAFRTDRRQRDF